MAEAADYQVSARHEGGVEMIAIRGRVTVGNAQRLLDDITAQLRPELREVQLDLAGVEYFDSGGGAVLLRLRQRLTVYPEYIVHKAGFMAPVLEPRLRAMVDEDGYPLDDEKGVASP